MEVYFWDYRNKNIPPGVELYMGYSYYKLIQYESYIIKDFLKLEDYVKLKYDLVINGKVIKNNKIRIIEDIEYLGEALYVILKDTQINEALYNNINDITSISKHRNIIINEIIN